MAKPVREIFVFKTDGGDDPIDKYSGKIFFQDFLIGIIQKYKGTCVRMEFHPIHPSFSTQKTTLFKTEEDRIEDFSGKDVSLMPLADGTLAFPSM